MVHAIATFVQNVTMDVEYLMLRQDMDIMDMDSVPDMSSSSCQVEWRRLQRWEGGLQR